MKTTIALIALTLFFSPLVFSEVFNFEKVTVFRNTTQECENIFNSATRTLSPSCVTTETLAVKNERNSELKSVRMTVQLPIECASSSFFKSETSGETLECEMAGSSVSCEVKNVPAGEEKTVSYTTGCELEKVASGRIVEVKSSPSLATVRVPGKARVGDTVNVQLVSISGKPIEGEAVNAIVNGTIVGMVTDENGEARFLVTRPGKIDYVIPSEEYLAEEAATTFAEGLVSSSTPVAAAATIEKNLFQQLSEYSSLAIAALMLALILVVVFAFGRGRHAGVSEDDYSQPVMKDIARDRNAGAFEETIITEVGGEEKEKNEAGASGAKTQSGGQPLQAQRPVGTDAIAQEIQSKLSIQDSELQKIDEMLYKLKQTIPKKVEEKPAEQKQVQAIVEEIKAGKAAAKKPAKKTAAKKKKK